MKIKEYDLLKLFDQYLMNGRTGRRLQKNGNKIRQASLEPYAWLRKCLEDFSKSKNFHLRVKSVSRLKKRELAAERKYWKGFYREFSDYLYKDLGCYDNYVGSHIKRLRAFFNYLNEEKELGIGNFHKSFYVYKEEIDIIALLPEQLNYLIYDKSFHANLPLHLQRSKDMFVFGCAVALRFSDLRKLSWDHLEYFNGKVYIQISSQKTNTHSRIMLPEYAVKILDSQSRRRRKVFPEISGDRFNSNIKSIGEAAGWTQTRIKTRSRRGIPFPIYKNLEQSQHFRFCDLLSSHTMRRTAITTLLCLEMPETLVRKISGHAPGSKEFFRYVQFSQKFVDDESVRVYKKLEERKIHNLSSEIV
jgi:integrase